MSLEAARVTASNLAQGVDILRGKVRQGVLLEIGPEGLHGVEFGSVGRKQDTVGSAASVEKLLDGSGPVPRKPVPYRQEGLRRWVARSRRNSINQETVTWAWGRREK